MKYIAFLIYIILWDGVILLGTGYVVFILGKSGWWFLLAYILMVNSFKTHHFGIGEETKPTTNKERGIG